MKMKKNKLLEESRIKPKDYKELLQNLQAGILKSHGRDQAVFLLLKFNAKGEKGLKKVKERLASKTLQLTSAWEQFKTPPKSNKTVRSLFISSKGYEVLGYKNSKSDESAFEEGMKKRRLGDPPIKAWEKAYKEPVHAMLLLANDSLKLIKPIIAELEKEWGDYIEIIHKQYGEKLVNSSAQAIEHFGYVDGISQPLFLQSDFYREDENGKKQKRFSTDVWKPEAPLGLVLTKDPFVKNAIENVSYGSYLVYRKLEQNVKAFKKAEGKLATQLGFEGEAEEIAGALMVGRFENGLPVVQLGNGEDPEENNEENDFDYSKDQEGKRCPFHSHIRKVNPRGDATRAFGMKEEEERSHRIVRRGIPYDEMNRNGDLSFYPDRGVGLLFLCFQSSIENQFEFIQKKWANNNDFPVPFTGIDPLIGQGENRKDANGGDAEQKWPAIQRSTCSQSLGNFIKMKGGAYFFTPSLSFIKSLSN